MSQEDVFEIAGVVAQAGNVLQHRRRISGEAGIDESQAVRIDAEITIDKPAGNEMNVGNNFHRTPSPGAPTGCMRRVMFLRLTFDNIAALVFSQLAIRQSILATWGRQGSCLRSSAVAAPMAPG